MKRFFFLAAFLGVVVICQAQTPNTVINCTISNGRVNYGHLDQLLPDNLKDDLLIDVRKKFNLKNGYDILLWLEQQGWKLSAVDANTSGMNGTVTSSSIYILTREIYLDDAARSAFVQNLENIENKHRN